MIVLTAPTSRIGSQVLDRLLDADEPVRVVARDPSRLPSRARGRIEVVQGSHGDKEVVDLAFADADAVFWLLPPQPQAETVEAAYVDFTRPAAEAFTRQEVSRVVGISALGRGTAVADRAGYVTGSLAQDDLIASTGVAFRALTMPSFTDNTLRSVGTIRDQGVLFSTISPDRKLPTTATRDIAAVAAELLLDHSWTGVEELPVLGPEDLSYDDMARIISEVLGTPVRFQQVSGDALRTQMTGSGMSDAMAQGMVDMMLAKDTGLDDGVSRTQGTTGPTTFRQWCEEVLRPAVQA